MKLLIGTLTILVCFQSNALAQSAGERLSEARIQARNAEVLQEASEDLSPWEQLSAEERFDLTLRTYLPYRITIHGVSFNNSQGVGAPTQNEITKNFYEGLETQRINLMNNPEDRREAQFIMEENITRAKKQFQFEFLGGDITLLIDTVDALQADVSLTGNPNSAERLEKIYASFDGINAQIAGLNERFGAVPKENPVLDFVGYALAGTQMQLLSLRIDLLNLRLSNEVPREQALRASNALNTLAWNYSPSAKKQIVVDPELAPKVRQAIEKLYSDTPSEFTNQYYEAITKSIETAIKAVADFEKHELIEESATESYQESSSYAFQQFRAAGARHIDGYRRVDRLWRATKSAVSAAIINPLTGKLSEATFQSIDRNSFKNATTRLDRLATGVLQGYAETSPVSAYMSRYIQATGR